MLPAGSKIPYQNEHGVWAGEVDASEIGIPQFTRVELTEAGAAVLAGQVSGTSVPLIGDDLYRIAGGAFGAVELGTATFFAQDTQAVLLQNIGMYLVRAFCQVAPDSGVIDTTATTLLSTGFAVFEGSLEGAIEDALVVRPQGILAGEVVYSQTGLIVPSASAPAALVPFLTGPYTDGGTWSVVTPEGQAGPPLRFDIAYLGGALL